MPEIISGYLETGNVALLKYTYHSLWTTYLDDIEKYAKAGDAMVLRHCLESSPFEAGTRIKFEGFGRSNYKSRQVSESLKLAQQAMLIDLQYPTTQMRPPIVLDRKSPAPESSYTSCGAETQRWSKKLVG